MISNFDRARVQVLVEESIGCHDVRNFKQHLTKFTEFKVTSENKHKLIESCDKDGRDLFFKGALSLAQGLSDVNHGLHSWAITKFYYSIFYFLKSSLALRGFALLRGGGPIYSLMLKENELPHKTTGQKGDHKTTLKLWRELIGESNDILLSNNIDDVEPYVWLMNAREVVQYRRKTFLEPRTEGFFANLVSKDLSATLDIYANDLDPIYPFEKDNACLALPVMRALLSFDDLKSKGQALSGPEKVVLKELIKPIVPAGTKLGKIFY